MPGLWESIRDRKQRGPLLKRRRRSFGLPDSDPRNDAVDQELGHVGGSAAISAAWSADFQAGTYEVDGVAVAVTDLFEEDVNWGTFDPATQITPTNGLRGAPVLKHATAKAHAVGGATYIIEGKLRSTTAISLYFGLADATFFGETFEMELRNGGGNSRLFSFNGSQNFSNPANATLLKIGLTIKPDAMAVSIDGGAVTAFDPGTPQATLATLIISCEFFDMYSLSAIDAVANADLPGLSTQ